MIVVPGGQGLITGVSAGVGLSGGGTEGTVTLTLDLSELSAVTPANGDSLATIDSDGSTEQLTTIAALATLLAGAGLTASSSVIGADDSTASAKGIVIVAGGDGISVSYSSGTATSAVDLGTNSGLEISSNKLQIAKGISQHDVAQFTSGVADDDFLRVDGTTIEGRSASEVLSDISAAPAAGSANILTTGALDSGSITSGFGNIDTGSSTITTTGAVSTGTIAASDDVTIAADAWKNSTNTQEFPLVDGATYDIDYYLHDAAGNKSDGIPVANTETYDVSHPTITSISDFELDIGPNVAETGSVLPSDGTENWVSLVSGDIIGGGSDTRVPKLRYRIN